jgi:membrane protein implicated in regulation of membrane protease activity
VRHNAAVAFGLWQEESHVDWLKDSLWLVWLGGGLVAGLLELASMDFVFAMVAGGALVAAGSAALGASFPAQVLIFAGASAGFLLGVRPLLKRWAAGSTPLSVTGTAALVDQPALVLTQVTEVSGTVKLKGETWTARVAEPGAVLPIGTPALVVRIEGATAVVRASERATPQDTD